jgi:hypothetical protein
MTTAQGQQLLDAVLDSWDRSNVVLVNLLRALPAGGLDASGLDSRDPMGRKVRSSGDFDDRHTGRVKVDLEVRPTAGATALLRS